MSEVPGGSLTLLGVFLVGLGLNLTPCVYPMMSVTVSLFGNKHHHSTRSESFLRALIYVLGIATMYSSIGVAAAFTGGFFGSLLQNKLILVLIAAVLFALSLSMFGVYTFQFPSWILSRLGSEKKASLIGIYFSGLFVGVFAAPCIGPPVIALLTFVGTRGDPVFAFWVFFVMSFGLGFPYLILGTFSGLLKKLPKAGFWLVWVEHLFGFILLVLVAFYLLIAFAPEYIGWLTPIALSAGAIYLGFLEKSGNQNVRFKWLKRTLGIVGLAATIALPYLSPKERLVWDEYSPDVLETAKQNGKPVMIDFYADWCIPCHELDQFTYSDPKVIHALAGFQKYKIDLTDLSSPEFAKLVERFEVVGVPTVIFIDPKGNEAREARISGFVDPEEFLSLTRTLPFEQAEITAINE